jgi:hypothetical protein
MMALKHSPGQPEIFLQHENKEMPLTTSSIPFLHYYVQSSEKI